MEVDVLNIHVSADPITGELISTEKRLRIDIPGILTEEEALLLDKEEKKAARNELRRAKLEKEDLKKIRALTESLLHGPDILVSGETPRNRLLAIEIAQEAIRKEIEK